VLSRFTSQPIMSLIGLNGQGTKVFHDEQGCLPHALVPGRSKTIGRRLTWQPASAYSFGR
jgi:hypothetical protein